MNSSARRLLLLAVGVVVVWYVVVVFWATRPLHDTVPVGNLPDWQEIVRDPADPAAPQPIGPGVVQNQKITCNAVFDSTAHDGAYPELPFPQQYNREPCDLAHSNGRTVFVLDTLVVAAVIGAVGAVLVRDGRRRRRDGATPNDDVDRFVGARR